MLGLMVVGLLRPSRRFGGGNDGVCLAADAYWQDGETLWTHTLACTSQNPIAHNNLGPNWPPADRSMRRLLITGRP